MFRAVREKITVQVGGRIELCTLQFAEGARAEVIVIEEPAQQSALRPLTEMIGRVCRSGSRGDLATRRARRLTTLPSGSQTHRDTDV